MNISEVTIDKSAVQKLLATASGDSALLYLYLKAGNDPSAAAGELNMTDARLSCALATLRQLGLWQERQTGVVRAEEKPVYTEQDVLRAMGTEPSFHALYGEVQRRLGRTLTTEELKILLGFVRYLGLPEDVICVLVTYCIDRARQRGSLRNPSLRSIEKEAYAWAEQGIDTMAEAAAFIHSQNLYFSRLGQLKRLLQLGSRTLTPGEEKFAKAWLDMGFADEVIAMAYERTCLNTGGLNWAYMNKILTRWKEAGFVTAEDVRNGDKKPSEARKTPGRSLDSEEQAAIARLLKEED